MHLTVIVATVGRAELAARTVALLGRQLRRPDRVIVVGAQPADTAGVGTGSGLPVTVLHGEKGLTRQRNTGLRALDPQAELVVFFDDDFVPAPDYLAEAEQAFQREPTLVGLTGRLIADGIHGQGYSVDQALGLILADQPPAQPQRLPRQALYGCNMVIRLSAARDLWFDEALPLYGWQEDIDFSYRVGARGGQQFRCDRLAGVHLGHKGGRQSGLRLGYSQIANPVYLLGKRSIPPRLAWRLMLRNLAANLLRSPWPEPHIDRLGRCKGNLLALAHCLTGRAHPGRILEL